MQTNDSIYYPWEETSYDWHQKDTIEIKAVEPLETNGSTFDVNYTEIIALLIIYNIILSLLITLRK